MLKEIFNILGADQVDFSYVLGEANLKEEDAFSQAKKLTHLYFLHRTISFLKMTKIYAVKFGFSPFKSHLFKLYIISTRHKRIVCHPTKAPIEYTANIHLFSLFRQNTYRSFHSAVYL